MARTPVERLSFRVADRGKVSALMLRPRGARALYVIGHGAGAGMRHPFLQSVCDRLCARKVATFRYQFPYMEAGRRFPDPLAVRLATVEAAVRRANQAAPRLPLFAGGKSMGGRMTSLAMATTGLPKVRGLIFLGFPLHPANKPATERGEHLADVKQPMLFLQGTRDALAGLELIEPLCASLRPRATLHIVDGADHGFAVLKRSGRTDDEVLDELTDTIAEWIT